MRRRFPYRAVVFLAFGMLGPLVCAAVPLLARLLQIDEVMPTRLSDLPLPPSPSLRNVLFGAGVHETALACAAAGYSVWSLLWNVSLPPEIQKQGFGKVFRALVGRGLLLGPLIALLALPVGMYGLYLREGPGEQPVVVRLFFGVLAAVITSASAVFTVTIPVVVILLGVLLGVGTAAAVAYLWPFFPEEPVLK